MATATSDPNQFTAAENSGRSILGVLFTSIWATQGWKRILKVEPETHPHFKAKHRSLLVKLFAFIAVVLVISGTMGVASGRRVAQNAKSSRLLNEIAVLGKKAAPTKAKFIEISRRDTPTIPKYVQRCSELEPVLNDYESELNQMLSLMTQEQPLVGTSAEWATVRQTLSIMTAVFQKDIEYVEEVRKEVDTAKQLRSTPVSQQSQFYKANITPILEQEQKTADEEVEIVKSAKARGVKLPEEFYRQYGIE